MLRPVKWDRKPADAQGGGKEHPDSLHETGRELVKPVVPEMAPLTLLYRVFWSLLVFEVLLVCSYLVNDWFGNPIESLGALINLDAETAIGTWLSSTQLLLIGCLFIGLRLLVGRCAVGRLFAAMGMGFIFLSMDETAAFHEKITGVLKRFEWAPRVAGNRGLWIPVYALTAAIFVLVFCKPIGAVVHRFPRQVGVFLCGAGLMVFGGIFLEMLGYYHLFENIPTIGIALEELGEMAGETLMILGVGACYLKQRGLQ